MIAQRQHAPAAPAATSFRPLTRPVLQRKCACGVTPGPTGECEECRKKRQLGLQAKLAVNQPGDVYEQEADAIADRVMSAPLHAEVRGAPLRIQRFSGQSVGELGTVPVSVHHALASPGRPLEPDLRQDMEHRFGHDFSKVRVHSDAAAAQSARDVNAHAYTSGHDIVFRADRFAPGTHVGRRLLAHELTHVVQQTGRGVPSIQRKELEGGHNWTTVKQITAQTRTMGRGRALTSDNQTLPINIEVNNLNVGTYEMKPLSETPDSEAWTRIHMDSTRANRFIYLLPPGVTLAPTMTIVIVPKSREQQARDKIKTLPPHIRDFLIGRGEREVSGEDLQKIARAARILQEHGVTEDELLLQRQRRIDWQAIGLSEGELVDPETWALSYVGYHKKARGAAQANATSLLDTARRLSLIPPNILRMTRGNVLGVLDPSKELANVYRRRIAETNAYAKISSEPIAFSTFEDLQQTLAAFEDALVADLRQVAAAVLDETEARLLRMDKQFVGASQPTKWSSAYLWREIEKIRSNPEVAKVLKQHEESAKAINREIAQQKLQLEQQKLPEPGRGAGAEPKPDTRDLRSAQVEKKIAGLEKEKKQETQQYKESLSQKVAETSPVKLSLGSDVHALLSSKDAGEAHRKLTDYLINGRSKVRDARAKLDDRKFLYAAKQIIDKEKEHLGRALGSKPGDIVSGIIDQLARERREQTTIWDDIWKVLEFVAMFIPGPFGWGVRFGLAARKFNERMEASAAQSTLYGAGLSAVPPDPNASLSALGEFALEVVPDASLAEGAKGAKRLTSQLEKELPGKAARQGERTATSAGTSAAREGEQSVAHAAGESKVPPRGGGKPPAKPSAVPEEDIRGNVIGKNREFREIRGANEVAALRDTEEVLSKQRPKLEREWRQQKDLARSMGDKADRAAARAADEQEIKKLESAFDAQQAKADALETELRELDKELGRVRTRLVEAAPPVSQPSHLPGGKKMEGEIGEAFDLGPKNNLTMVNPDPKKANFIPDHIQGNPTSLRWGKPYHFKEIKDWADMSDTGNLSAMLDYVDNIGGSQMTIYYKSNTYMSGPLKSKIERLMKNGKVKLVPFVGE